MYKKKNGTSNINKLFRIISVLLKIENLEFKSEIKTLSLIKLYELGKISYGFAVKLLDMNRIDFLSLLEKCNVSYFYKEFENELESDFLNA